MFKGGNQGDLNGFLDAGSRLHGELHFDDTFRVDGKLEGSVIADGDLIVGENGEVDGEIKVKQVFISGTVRGTVRATQKIEITAAGKVYADLYAPSLSIEDGAHFEGRCSMEQGARPGNVASIAAAGERGRAS